MLRCIEVRFADTQVDYIHSSSTQFGTLLGHRQSLRLGKRLHQQRRFLLHKSMYYIVLVIVISSYGLSWENTHACAGTPAHTHILRTKVQNLCRTRKVSPTSRSAHLLRRHITPPNPRTIFRVRPANEHYSRRHLGDYGFDASRLTSDWSFLLPSLSDAHT